jgi:hypothetical protein
MTASIRNTITTALSAQGVNVDVGYGEYVDAAVDALTEREYTFTDQIVDVVSYEFGVSADIVRGRLELAGMAVRPAPEPEPAFVPSEEWEKELLGRDDSFTAPVEVKKDKGGKKDKLAKRIKRLEKLAREHGLLV